MKSKFNISRKKVELLHLFATCQTKQDYIKFNNSVLLPLYNRSKEIEKERCDKRDFSEITEGEFYLSDFNFLYDCQYFLCDLSGMVHSELDSIHFQKYGWVEIDVN